MVRVLVAGAGIGGLTAALALARAGIDVTLIERASQFEAVGAGLQLSPNATSILDRLGVLAALKPRASAPADIVVRNARNGRVITTMPLDDAEQRWGAPYLVALRADLQGVLADAVAADRRIDLRLGTSLAGFGTNASGVVATIRSQGITRSVEGDVLIGADGARSIVRSRLAEGGDNPPGNGARGVARAHPAADLDPCHSTGSTSLWLGPDAHLVHYTVKGGKLINIVAITREKPDGIISDLWSTPGDPAQIRARFAAWHMTARHLINAPREWTAWPLYDRAPLGAWNAGPVALLGDAAHPILPFLAQGSAQAIEDAAALADAVAGARHNLHDALADYSQRRRVRAERIQQTSRELGRIYHLSGPAAVARDITMRVIGGRRLLARYDWLYSSHADANRHKPT